MFDLFREFGSNSTQVRTSVEFLQISTSNPKPLNLSLQCDSTIVPLNPLYQLLE